MNKIYEKHLKCFESFRKMISFKPEIALTLGSGLGNFADNVDVKEELSYAEIDGFPVSTVPGHEGKFILGYLKDVPVVLMKGRVHMYEGYDVSDVVLPARLMYMMGAKTLFLTNASGGINPDFYAGAFMMIKDHISLFVRNPLVGPNDERLGIRFPDMTHVYDEGLQDVIRKVAKENDIELFEGVYAQLSGPSFETPAEIRMLRTLGIDAVGMSTVVEAIAARHVGMKVCGLSCVANLAAGMNTAPLTHDEVQEAANKAAPRFTKLVTESISEMYKAMKE
ncbi:MAG: purine-nucleoside phosphorylase [Lachnospiraceae bacterium]|nr:purine-nucleoside phosphorylase [Lachnospiraceae bacterium]